MAKGKTTKPVLNPAGAEAEEPPVWANWLTHVAFVLTLILAAGRILMIESVRDSFDMPHSLAGPTGPGPTTSLVLDALACVPALLVLLRRAVDRTYIVRLTSSQALLMLLAAWAAVSFAWSTDKFVTTIAAANTVAAAVLVWSSAQLVRSWTRLRIVVGVCLGLLMACWAHGLIYRYVDYPENVRFWQENKEKFFHDQGWEPNSFAAKQFEKKVLSGELVGFNQSANSFAAVIVLLLVTSAGVAIQRWVSGDAIGWSLVAASVCVPALLVLWFTDSRTAAGTVLIAAIALSLLAITALRVLLPKFATRAYVIVTAFAILGSAALIGHGIYHGSLPQDSLNFRWRYWVAASRVVAHHPVLGVGWGDFGEHYLAVRVPAAAEEIRDPHNFLVRCFAELGWIGGLIALAWLARAAWELSRPVAPRDANPTARMSVSGGFATIAAIALGAVLLNTVAAIDWTQAGAFLLLEVFRRLLWLGVLLVGLVVATIRSRSDQRIDDRPAYWILAAVLIGLGVFFIHNLMDFVLAEAGAMTLFAVVLGAASGARTPWGVAPTTTTTTTGSNRHRALAIGVLVAGSLAWMFVMIALVFRVAGAEQLARDGDAALHNGRPDVAAASFRGAFTSVPFNADYVYRSARALVAAGAPPLQVETALGLAIATDPANVTYLGTRAEYELAQAAPDAAAVRADFERMMTLDPRNLEARRSYAQALEKLNDRPGAAAQYRKMLEISNGYDPTEPKRLSPADAARITALIAQLDKQ